jgi:hypothetical protein
MIRQAVVFSLLIFFVSPANAQLKTVRAGWVENVQLKDTGTMLKAKLDTGAQTSSIDAEIIDIVENDKHAPRGTTGDKVVFSIMDATQNKKIVFERYVLRYVKIKRKISGSIRRPVVAMTFCIAGRTTKEEVNLADRENFVYPVLVGRNMLSHAKLLVDASKTFTRRASCGDTNQE